MNNNNYKSKFSNIDSNKNMNKDLDNLNQNLKYNLSPYLQENTPTMNKSGSKNSKFYPMLNEDRNNPKKRPISTANLMRPPSRHKLPNKQLGLDTPYDPENDK